MTTASYVGFGLAGIAGGLLAGYFAFKPQAAPPPVREQSRAITGGLPTTALPPPAPLTQLDREFQAQKERLPPAILTYNPGGAIEDPVVDGVWQRVAGHPGVMVAPASELTQPRNPYQSNSVFVPQNVGMELAQDGEIVTIGDVYYVRPRGELRDYVSAQVGGVRMTKQAPVDEGSVITTVPTDITPMFPGRPGVSEEFSAANPWEGGAAPAGMIGAESADQVGVSDVDGLQRITISPGRLPGTQRGIFALTGGRPLRTPGGNTQGQGPIAPGQAPSIGVTYR